MHPTPHPDNGEHGHQPSAERRAFRQELIPEFTELADIVEQVAEPLPMGEEERQSRREREEAARQLEVSLRDMLTTESVAGIGELQALGARIGRAQHTISSLREAIPVRGLVGQIAETIEVSAANNLHRAGRYFAERPATDPAIAHAEAALVSQHELADWLSGAVAPTLGRHEAEEDEAAAMTKAISGLLEDMDAEYDEAQAAALYRATQDLLNSAGFSDTARQDLSRHAVALTNQLEALRRATGMLASELAYE